MSFLAGGGSARLAALKKRNPDILVLVGALVGLALCLVLVWIGLGGDSVTGCGAGGCNAVLGSRWSQVFRIPVAWYGTVFYGVWLACEIAKLRIARTWLAGAAVGAAIWFISVQAFLLKAFCPWCMSAHGVGLALGFLVLLSRSGDSRKNWLMAAMASFLGIGLAQVYGPEKASHMVESLRAGGSKNADDRHARFDGGNIRFDLEKYPRIGSPTAKHVIVELFDYQCISCRVMSGYLKELVEKYPEQVAVLLVPVPMDRACNPFLKGGAGYEGSCEISRIALRIWTVAPESFGSFHEAMMNEPSATLARDLALAFLDEADLQGLVRNKELASILEHDIRCWQRLSGSSSSLPKLLVGDQRVIHGLPASKSAFFEIMRTELSLD